MRPTKRWGRGPKFVAKHLAARSEGQDVHHRITPGRPTESGRAERFNRTVREDVLDFWTFASLRSHHAELSVWRERYDRSNPHQAPAVPYATQPST